MVTVEKRGGSFEDDVEVGQKVQAWLGQCLPVASRNGLCCSHLRCPFREHPAPPQRFGESLQSICLWTSFFPLSGFLQVDLTSPLTLGPRKRAQGGFLMVSCIKGSTTAVSNSGGSED